MHQRRETNRTVTLAAQYRQLKETGRLDALKLRWKDGMNQKPHCFWDSDVAKWMEACAYSLETHPDPDMEQICDDVIADLEQAQWEDGYLNSYFTVVAPEKRWTDLHSMHELYCAGHLMEAAVAYFHATGKDKFLRIVCRYADHIASVFGREPGKIRGYPGHEEIELALVKLYRTTGNPSYLNLSRYFIDERGQAPPHYFDLEKERNRLVRTYDYDRPLTGKYAYYQAHVPVREQSKADGHAVRAMYLFSGMADLAALDKDPSLREACLRLYENTVFHRMYLTGGLGSCSDVERFTFDYDLPSETAYAETCAAIGLVFFCRRMFFLEGDGKYMDTLERALYNGVLSGVGLDGVSFFYANPLAVKKEAVDRLTLFRSSHMGYIRRPWFGCACCPTNTARLLASLGSYCYSIRDSGISVDLYADSLFSHGRFTLRQSTNYPWDGRVEFTVESQPEAPLSLFLRIPGWCRSYEIRKNGERLSRKPEKGYVDIGNGLRKGDRLVLDLDMPVEAVMSHPESRETAGKAALQRGPVVYCAESADNPFNLFSAALFPDGIYLARRNPDLLGGSTFLEGTAYLFSDEGFSDTPYPPCREQFREHRILLIPYFLWGNREPGDMTVWFWRKRE